MTAARDEIIADLNRLMAEELEASLRYFQIRFRLKGIDRLAAGKLFEDATEETFEHADALAKMIRSLGHTPQLNINLQTTGGPLTLDEALQEILEVEKQALEAYQEFLPKVAGDPVLEDFIRKQIATETEHCQEIAMLLE